ncbi:metalloreductase-like protein Fre8 [Plenodomus tracheiphilus IPT5]|uniref:Metalloreductase-like protein Fre8 n=1 Tax=Plenodomus tracheiphilus IPT5 TaxID=1408161 RepID=A0A6A7ASY6_9PLEO|nr:metalloreductase-like protein Fre8 [Plenodomus tracheiphilus IPT5]
MDLFQRHKGHHEVEIGQYLGLGYYSVTLTDAQKHQRRETLDRYGFIAQWSVLVVFIVFQLGFLVSWVLRSGLEYDQPKSPSFNKRLGGKSSWLKSVQVIYSRTVWWMKKDIISGWGTRGEWIGATAWTAWLLFLCITQTGKDYLHLTKRFGQIGASQLPIHYLLAMRAPYSPVQWLTRLSHEQIKVFHQILGRITFFLFLIHAALYIAFFVLSGLLAKRIQEWDVIWGTVSIILFSAISTTALAFVRRRNYRVFYISHIAIANVIIVPLYLHCSHIRIYIYQVVLVEVLHLVFRALRLKMYQGTIRLLPGTNLVQIRIPLPSDSSAVNWKPGQHVYLSRPPRKGKAPTIYDQWIMVNKTNPFTIASLPEKDKELLLIARTLKGNTKHLAEIARSLSQGGSGVPMLPTAGGDIPILPLILEGPYGASDRLPDLSDYDQVLLVAGGVGASFIVPIYRSIVELHDPTPAGPKIRCIWAVQNIAEIQWAFPATSSAVIDDDDDDDAGREANGDGLLRQPNAVEVYVTRASGPRLQADASASGVFAVGPDGDEEGEDFELQENEQLLGTDEQMEKPRKGVVVRCSRPKMSEVVDEVFSKGSRTAVICCGPQRLTADLRRNVEVWVHRGHDVFWYDETFGW